MLREADLKPYLANRWGLGIACLSVAVSSLLLFNGLYQGIMGFTSPASFPQIKRPVSYLSTHKVLPNIASWHLFGSSLPVLDQQNHLPTTTLKLSLMGLFNDTFAKQSKALIAAPGHPDKAYGIGDVLPGGATIYQILNDSVILARDGHLEKLTLPIQAVKFG